MEKTEDNANVLVIGNADSIDRLGLSFGPGTGIDLANSLSVVADKIASHTYSKIIIDPVSQTGKECIDQLSFLESSKQPPNTTVSDISDEVNSPLDANGYVFDMVFLNFILETINAGMWDLNLVTHTAYRSLVHDQIFGYESLLPKWTYEMFLEHVIPEDREEVDRKFRHAVDTQGEWRFECRIRRVDGEIKWILATGRYRVNKDDGNKHMAGIVQDITVRKQSEEELKRTQDRFSILTQNLSSGVALIDDLGQFAIVNEAFLRLFELDKDSSIKNVNDRNWDEWQVFDENGQLLDVDEHPVRKAAITGKAVNSKLVAVQGPLTSELKWMLITAEPIYKSSGKLDAIICTYQEVTDLKRTQEALHESERLFRIMGETVPYGIWLRNPDGGLRYSSQAFLDLLDMTQEELQFADWTTKFLREDVQAMSEKWQQCCLLGTPWEHEYNIVDKYGEMHTVLSKGLPVRDDKGNITCWAGLNLDITDRKKIENELQRNHELLQSLIDYTPALVFAVDREEHFIIVNKALAETLGKPSETLVKATRHGLMPEEWAVQHESNDQQVFESGIANTMEEHVVLNGTPITYLSTKFPIKDTDGRVYAVAGMSTDVTERKLAEQQREELLEREHHIADVLQKAILPPKIEPEILDYRIAVTYRPALKEAEIGGDFYDVFQLDDNKLAVIIGDVAGKGLQAALRVSSARYAIRSYAYIDSNPGRVLTQANAALCRDSDDISNILTVFFAVFDPQFGTMLYATAAHDPPVVFCANGGYEELAIGGLPLGLMENTEYQQNARKLDAGDLVVMVTDGIIEARAPGAELFEKERLVAYIQEHRDLSLEELVNGILNAATEHSCGQLQDDAAIVAITR